MKLKKDSNIRENCRAACSGLLIGLGVIINTLTDLNFLGALMFSFGLSTVIELKLPLYTGKIGFLKNKNYLSMLLFNLLGIAGTFYMYCLANPAFYQLLSEKAEIKFQKGYLQLLICGMFCGFLVHFAVKMRCIPLTTIAVMIFILIGSEHCVADFPYLLTCLSINNIIKFLLIIIGNSIGAIFLEKILIGKNNEI